jgi:hypothetical protein
MTDNRNGEILDWRYVKTASSSYAEGSIGRPSRLTKVVPFPVVRRRAFINKIVKQVISRTPAAGRTHLSGQLRRQAEVLRRKGIPDFLIQRELRALNVAVRVELWRVVFGGSTPGGSV